MKFLRTLLSIPAPVRVERIEKNDPVHVLGNAWPDYGYITDIESDADGRAIRVRVHTGAEDAGWIDASLIRRAMPD